MKKIATLILALGLAVGGYNLVAQGDGDDEAPSPATLVAEQGGTYVEGTQRVLLTGASSVLGIEYELINYETTKYPCTRLVMFVTSPTPRKIGRFGGCGTPPVMTLHYNSGGLRDDVTGAMYGGIYGYSPPAGTTHIVVTLDDGRQISVDNIGPVWAAIWGGGQAHVTKVAAYTAGGVKIPSVSPPMSCGQKVCHQP